MRKLWEAGEGFAQDECGLAGPKDLKSLLDQRVSLGPGRNWVPTRGALGGGWEKYLYSGLARDAHPWHTHIPHTYQGQLSSPGLQCSVCSGTEMYWLATAMKAFPLLDPCPHCRILTRRREGGGTLWSDLITDELRAQWQQAVAETEDSRAIKEPTLHFWDEQMVCPASIMFGT